MNGFVLVAAGGAIGAALRHGAGLGAIRLGLTSWPHSTFFVNVSGSLAMGLLMGWLAFRNAEAGQAMRLFFATGVLGGFTTFSAFSLELALMVEKGELSRAMTYAGLSVVVGLIALFVGLYIARRAFA